jgi:hypothetical protein
VDNISKLMKTGSLNKLNARLILFAKRRMFVVAVEDMQLVWWREGSPAWKPRITITPLR